MESTTIKPGSGWVQNHRQLWLVEELEPDRRGVRLVCWHATSGGGLERQQSHVSVQDLLEGGEWRRASDDEVQELTERLLRTPARDAVAGLQQRGRDAAVAAEGAAVDRERLEARQRAAAERRAGRGVPALDKMLWAGVGESEAAPVPTSAALTADVSPVVVDRGELKDLFFSSPLKEQDMDDEQRRLHELAGHMHEMAGHMHELGERLIYGARELRTLAGATDDTNEG